MKNITYSDIECYIESVKEKIGDNTYKISDHVPIAVGFSFNGNYKSNFGLNSIKDYDKDLLEIETEKNFKLNIPIIFNKKINYITKLITFALLVKKNCINKVRDHCHQTSKYRGPSCNNCNLNYKQQTSLQLYFKMVKAMTSI